MNKTSKLLPLVFLTFLMLNLSAQQSRTNRTIDVIGTAEHVLVPDQVMVQIIIENSESGPKEAQAKTSQAATRALSYLKSRNSVKSIETNYVNLRPQRIDYNKDTYRYIAIQNITFTLEDVGDYQNVIIDLMERGVNGIGNVRFDSSQREKAEQELLAKAIKNAREKAVFMASQLGQQIDAAVHISDRISQNQGDVPLQFKSSVMEDGSGSIAPGELRITAQVNVVFELK